MCPSATQHNLSIWPEIDLVFALRHPRLNANAGLILFLLFPSWHKSPLTPISHLLLRHLYTVQFWNQLWVGLSWSETDFINKTTFKYLILSIKVKWRICWRSSSWNNQVMQRKRKKRKERRSDGGENKHTATSYKVKSTIKLN